MNEGSIISFPFVLNTYGQVETTTDYRLAWQHRVILTLLTRTGERVIRPGFGTSLASTLFETESLAIETAQRAVTIAFNEFLNSLELIEVKPQYDFETGSLVIPVTYSLPSGEVDTVTLRTAIFNRSGDLLQELTNG